MGMSVKAGIFVEHGYRINISQRCTWQMEKNNTKICLYLSRVLGLHSQRIEQGMLPSQ